MPTIIIYIKLIFYDMNVCYGLSKRSVWDTARIACNGLYFIGSYLQYTARENI